MTLVAWVDNVYKVCPCECAGRHCVSKIKKILRYQVLCLGGFQSGEHALDLGIHTSEQLQLSWLIFKTESIENLLQSNKSSNKNMVHLLHLPKVKAAIVIPHCEKLTHKTNEIKIKQHKQTETFNFLKSNRLLYNGLLSLIVHHN